MTAPTVPTTEGGVDPKETAKLIAAAAVAHAKEKETLNPLTEPPAPSTKPAPTEPVAEPVPPPTDALPTPAKEPGVTPPAPTEVITATEAVAVAAEAGVPLDEAVEALAEFGISVEVEGVPDDLRDRYGKLLEGVKSVVAPVFEQEDRIRTKLQQMEVFTTRLHEKPESILLALWHKKPEAFAKIAEIAERAKDDEDFRATVVREVELEARESDIFARETRHVERELEDKGRRAEVATVAAARRHGVDPAVADRYIAGMIKDRGSDFDLSSIDAFVAQLKPRVVTPKAPPMVTPEAARAAEAAPTAPVGESPPAAPGSSSGLNSETVQPGRGGFLRGLIKEAGVRVDKMTS